MLVAASYYTRLPMQRLADLMGLPLADVSMACIVPPWVDRFLQLCLVVVRRYRGTVVIINVLRGPPWWMGVRIHET